MTNISKQKLPREIQQELIRHLASLFSHVDKKTSADLFHDLLTDAEEVMLVKRLAIIVMLAQNHSTYKIAKALQVSDVTVALIRSKRESGAYDAILSIIKRKKFDSEKFWLAVEVILRGGMPSMAGKDRWKQL